MGRFALNSSELNSTFHSAATKKCTKKVCCTCKVVCVCVCVFVCVCFFVFLIRPINFCYRSLELHDCILCLSKLFNNYSMSARWI